MAGASSKGLNCQLAQSIGRTIQSFALSILREIVLFG